MRMLRALWAVAGRWYVLVALTVVAGSAAGYVAFFNVYPGRPQIAIIDIPFTVIDEDSAWIIGKMMDYARETDSIKGVVIKLITPGGGAPESEELYLRMRRLRGEKPVVIATGWISASGGMYMSMGSNYIYAESSSFVGSIGVILGLSGPRPPDELLISTGPAKLTGGAARTFTGLIELLKESFIQTVVAERGDRLKISAAELSEARVYVGLEAVRLGLIDAIGTEIDAIEKAASLAGVSNYELVDVNEKVLRELILQLRRILAPADVEEAELGLHSFSQLRGLASAAPKKEGQPGARPDFPIDVNLPRTYYLYVTPTE